VINLLKQDPKATKHEEIGCDAECVPKKREERSTKHWNCNSPTWKKSRNYIHLIGSSHIHSEHLLGVMVHALSPKIKFYTVLQTSPSDSQRWMYCIITTRRVSGTAAMCAGPIRLQLSHDFKESVNSRAWLTARLMGHAKLGP
jgi:hypothetical protein